jgi:hypothetical protein
MFGTLSNTTTSTTQTPATVAAGAHSAFARLTGRLWS